MSYKKQTFVKKKKDNFHVIYGKHAIEAVFNNEKRIIYQLFLDQRSEKKLNLPDLSNIDVEYCDREKLEKLCKDGDKHQGCVAYISDLLENFKLDDYINEFEKKEKVNVVILDQINDPHNLGAILRSAMCFKIDLVVITKYNMPTINASVIRSSAGMSECVNILTVTNLNDTIAKFKSIGFHIVGMDASASENIRNSVKKSTKFGIVMGSEGSGMRPSVCESCNEMVKIGINPEAESLNVSNAAAIAMYEMFCAQS